MVDSSEYHKGTVSGHDYLCCQLQFTIWTKHKFHYGGMGIMSILSSVSSPPHAGSYVALFFPLSKSINH